MSKCDISIEQLAAERAYRPGDTIEGTVRVSVDADCSCNGLRLVLRWATHGKGSHTEGVAYEELLFVGDWQAGRRYEHEFAIPVPDGPFTYRGTFLNVDWALVVTADLPWAIDPTERSELAVLPPEVCAHSVRQVTEDDHGAVPAEALPHLLASTSDMRGKVTHGGLFFGMVLLTIGAHCLWREGGESLLWGLAASAIPFLLGSLSIAGWLMHRKAESKLGRVSTRVIPSQGGEPLRCVVTVPKLADVELQAAKAELKVEERVVVGSGSRRDTLVHVVLLRDSAFHPSGDGSSSVEASLAIPAGAPFSFAGPNNALLWTLELRLDIPGLAEWHDTLLLWARPGPPAPATPYR